MGRRSRARERRRGLGRQLEALVLLVAEWIELRGQRARARGAHRVQVRGRVPRIRREIAVELPVTLAVFPLRWTSLAFGSLRATCGARCDRRRGRGLGGIGSRLVDGRFLGQILGDVRGRVVREREARDLVDCLLRRGRGRHHEERVLAARAAHARAAGRHARVVELEFRLAALAGNDHATCFGAAGGPLEAGTGESVKDPASPLEHRRLVIVTGKGGTGKTSVSAALALGAAARGRRVLVAAVDPDARLPALLSARPRPARLSARARARGTTWVYHIEPFEALGEYLGLQLGTRRLVDPVLRQRGFRQLLLASPGWRELITLGKVWHFEQQMRGQGDVRVMT